MEYRYKVLLMNILQNFTFFKAILSTEYFFEIFYSQRQALFKGILR